MKKKIMVLALIFNVSVLPINSNAETPEGDRYATGICMSKDGTLKAVCKKIDPNGPCYKTTDCKGELIR